MFQVAPSITHRLEGRPGDFDQKQQGGRGKEGDQSVMALRSRSVHSLLSLSLSLSLSLPLSKCHSSAHCAVDESFTHSLLVGF